MEHACQQNTRDVGSNALPDLTGCRFGACNDLPAPTRPLPALPFTALQSAPQTTTGFSEQFNETLFELGAQLEDLPVPWLSGGDPNGRIEMRTLLSSSSAYVGGSKRSLDDSDDSATAPRPQKSARPANSSTNNGIRTDDRGLVMGAPHFHIPSSGSRFQCSCGKSFTRKFRLNDHIETSKGRTFPCIWCPKEFSREDILRRHEQTVHWGMNPRCPGCFKSFRSDYLRIHMEKGCQDVILKALSDRGSLSSQAYANSDYSPAVKDETSEAMDCETLEGKVDTDGMDEGLAGIPGPKRPLHRRTRESCSICRNCFEEDEDDLIEHIHKHQKQLSEQSFSCSVCGLTFAFEKDWNRHAGTQERSMFEPRQCHGTGRVALSPWALQWEQDTVVRWENLQIRAHRLDIVRLLAERMIYNQPMRYSLRDSQVLALSSRFSEVSVQSFRSVPAWLKYEDDENVDELAAKLGLLGTSTPTTDATVSRPRPESMVIPSTSRALRTPDATPSVASYVQMVGNLRGPQFKTTNQTSPLRKAAGAATRYLMPAKSHIRELSNFNSIA